MMRTVTAASLLHDIWQVHITPANPAVYHHTCMGLQGESKHRCEAHLSLIFVTPENLPVRQFKSPVLLVWLGRENPFLVLSHIIPILRHLILKAARKTGLVQLPYHSMVRSGPHKL